jgi:phosphoribosylaminoimidazole carboxylase (NCAIR synthetase)
VPGAHLHDYEKEPRAGRKVGHVTVRADDDATLDDRLVTLSGVVDPMLNDATHRLVDRTPEPGHPRP